MTRLHATAAALALAVGLGAGPDPVLAKPKLDPATASKAVTQKIVDTLAAELERSMARMAIPGAAKPYLIGYKVTEVEVNDVVASLGAIEVDKSRHFVNLEAHVHVGSYKLDNSNFAIPQANNIDGIASVQLPLEATPAMASRAAWLATDIAYKEALMQLNAKRKYRRGGSTGAAAGVDSYTRSKANVQNKPVLVPAVDDAKRIKKRARAISSVFRDKGHVRESRVAFTTFIERRWYMNSEGSSAHDSRRVSGVIISVSGQASDGQELSLYYSRYGLTEKYLPSDKELIAEAAKLSKTLHALGTAPIMENYTGPVLFEKEGAVDIVRHTLAPHLGGTPVPEGLEKGQARQFGGALAARIGKGRVLSSMLSVVDDPTTRKHGRRTLIGGYAFDDEGMPAERVELIKNGKLVTLLMGRTPSKHIAKSNGHARRSAPGGGFHGSATNLFLRSKKGLGRKQLIAKLLAAAKDEGLGYGMIIRRLDDGAITAAPEHTTREILTLINTTDIEAPPPALLAYRVYPNGREELVRGVHLEPVPIRAWKDIIATSKKTTVSSYLASGLNGLVFDLRGIDGFVPSAGVESAVVTPDLLFKEIDLRGSSAGRRDAPAIPRPMP